MTRHPPVALAILTSLLALHAGCASGPDEKPFHSPSRDRHAIGAGRKDFDNKYQTTVKVLSANGTCSGILIAPRLVLTAAHCLCKITEEPFDRSRCQEKATVQRVFYVYDEDSKEWVPTEDSTRGSVIVHGDYASQYAPGTVYIPDGKKIPDLAAVQLERTLLDGDSSGEPGVDEGLKKELRADVKLNAAEVLLHQEIVVVGYGATRARGKDVGVRRFGANAVANLRSIDKEDRKKREIRLIFPGAKVYEGDSGGPCLLENEEGRWLVGIIGGYGEDENGGKESWITSTFGYRDWITEQIAKASTPAIR